MPQVVLQPGNPLDLRSEELEDLAQAIRELDPSYEVQIGYNEQVGRGVTWWEILTIWLPHVADAAAVAALLHSATAWAYRRFKKQEDEQIKAHEVEQAQQPKRRKSKPHIHRRPKYIEIFGPDGEVLKAMLISDPDKEPEDRTAAAKEQSPRRPPPVC